MCVPFSTPFLSFLWCVVDFWWNYSLMPLSTCAFTLNCLRLLVLHSPLSLRWMPKNQEKHGKKQRDICIIFSLASELVENESQTKHTHTHHTMTLVKQSFYHVCRSFSDAVGFVAALHLLVLAVCVCFFFFILVLSGAFSHHFFRHFGPF